MKPINKHITLIVLFLVGGFFITKLIYGLNSSYNKKIKNLVTPVGDVVVVGGVGHEKEMEWMRKTQLELELAHKPLDEAKKLIKEQRWQQALSKLNESMALHSKYGMNEWVLQTYFLDVYEALGDAGNSLKTVDWLILKCRNEEYMGKLKARREKILK